jgi:hypothetical protein
MAMPELSAELSKLTGTMADPASPSRLTHPQQLSHQKKPVGQASKIAPISRRRARNGPPHASRECGLSPIGWSFSTRPEPRPR